MVKTPPEVNGIMDLTDQEKANIKVKLQMIKAGFVASDDQQAPDTFYITATYNQQNPTTPINGDTCEMLLGN
ncbi:hypothetical protein [Bacillus sp. 1NLA3E]|uniref:hypothetical protein n=1 Tax=Bacillus sp. 1NLA3E TaxID=666686 RepID=UPI000247E643|nr:hypothetical protein [Bacillus sp. 1NLA3E]AGK52042.1 hypothetical protein B1NLA3E_01290 [Bacillus sp. 1NLA3E]